MPATSSLNIGNSSIFVVQLGYISDIASLFVEEDFRKDFDPENDAYSFYGYASRADRIRQRLTVLGVTSQAAMSQLEYAVKHAAKGDGPSSSEEVVEPDEFPDEPLNVEDVLARAKNYLSWELSAVDGFSFPKSYEDPRVFSSISHKQHLRLVLDLVPDDTCVELDLTGLKNDTCCYAMPSNLATSVHVEQQEDMATSLPLLVLPRAAPTSAPSRNPSR